MKIKLNKYINIVRPAPPRRADPEGVRDPSLYSVSYTHLDVYKRQRLHRYASDN